MSRLCCQCFFWTGKWIIHARQRRDFVLFKALFWVRARVSDQLICRKFVCMSTDMMESIVYLYDLAIKTIAADNQLAIAHCFLKRIQDLCCMGQQAATGFPGALLSTTVLHDSCPLNTPCATRRSLLLPVHIAEHKYNGSRECIRLRTSGCSL